MDRDRRRRPDPGRFPVGSSARRDPHPHTPPAGRPAQAAPHPRQPRAPPRNATPRPASGPRHTRRRPGPGHLVAPDRQLQPTGPWPGLRTLCRMMLHARVAVVGLPVVCLLLAPLSLAAQRATPVLQAFQQLADPRGGPAVHVLVEPDRGVSWRLGMAFQCRAGARPVVAIYLGPWQAVAVYDVVTWRTHELRSALRGRPRRRLPGSGGMLERGRVESAA